MLPKVPYAPPALIRKITSAKKTPANYNVAPGHFMKPGKRNTDLASIAGYFRSKFGMDYSEIDSRLQAINASSENSLSPEEVSAIARSIARYEPGSETGEFDDIPLARHMMEIVQPFCCRTEATGWLFFNGTKWVSDPSGARVKELIRDELQRLASLALAAGGVEGKKLSKHLLTASKLKKMFDLVSIESRLVKDVGEFDKAPGILNFPNGTLDIASGKLYAASPLDLVTKSAGVEFDPDAECPEFDKFLSETLDEEVAEFMLRLLGYSLLGNPTHHVFAVLHGSGRNGKSVLIDTVSHVLGDYAVTAEPSSFTKSKKNGVRNDLARLKGARMVGTSELASGEILDTALVKRITGGDNIAARALYKEHFEFKPEFVLFMTTNALPVIDGGDKALARRVILVPFKNVVSEENCDPYLPTKLRKEASGILNRLLHGLEQFLEVGLNIPAPIKKEIKDYVAHSDLIQNFLTECCKIDGDAKCSASALYQAYKIWSGGNGTNAYSQPIFKQEIAKATGIEQKRSNRGNVWSGIGLLMMQ